MNEAERKLHWENIYQTKALNEVSWYQPNPETSLKFIVESRLEKDAKIIDIGGGDGFLVDHLLMLGYTNISVLDISNAAIERAKLRLGNNASKINWIVSDVTTFESNVKFDLWHDRAAFHFLRNEHDIQSYVERLNRFTNSNSTFIIGAFSEKGPLKCSGIEIQQHTDKSLANIFKKTWNLQRTIFVNHDTPFGTQQHFIFSDFHKKD